MRSNLRTVERQWIQNKCRKQPSFLPYFFLTTTFSAVGVQMCYLQSYMHIADSIFTESKVIYGFDLRNENSG